MENTHNNISVGVTNNLVFIKVEGKGTFQISQPLRQLSLEMIGRGYREFVVDLSDCSSMDSTFLGVLAGMCLRLQNLTAANSKPATPPGAGATKVHLANLNARCLEVLRALGIDRLFCLDVCELRIGGQAASLPTQAALQPLQPPPAAAAASRERQAEVMLEAHRTLMEIEPQNVPKFKDVVRFISEDIEKLRAAAKPSGS
ncbi:MAG: STAS domain-containing protein [Verrucomicrobia bacterium]|nr:STAS domain-containing protein [Verrucomicrobiota bacterium]